MTIVVCEDNKHNWYTDNKSTNPNSLVKNGLAIILADDTTEKEIPFYRANTGTHTLEQCVKYGRFSYVKYFIDELITYKIENDLTNISDEEIEVLKIAFISSRVDQIKKNYTLVAQQQEEQMKQRLDADMQNRQLLLERVLSKNKD